MTDSLKSPAARARLAKEPYKERTEDELRTVVSTLCHFVWHKHLRPGEHLWTIPVDKERDFDSILSDGIDELVALRAEVEAQAQRLRSLEAAFQKFEQWQGEIIPVWNDEFFRASDVRAFAKEALAAAAEPAERAEKP